MRRAGFTLIEVIVALLILMAVLLTLMTLTGRTVQISTRSEREQAAIQLVTDRTDQVRSDPDYGALATRYAGTETSFPTLPGFRRTTTVVHDTSSGHNYKKITVSVTGPGLTTPIARTVSVAAP